MTGRSFGDSGAAGGLRDCALEYALVEVMPAHMAGLFVGVPARSGKNELPREFAAGAGELARESRRHRGPSSTCSKVGLVQGTHPLELTSYVRCESVGNHGDPVVSRFTLPDGDFTSVEVDILDAELQPFQKAQAGAVEERRGKSLASVEVRENGLDLVTGQDDRKPARLPGSDDAVG